MDGKPAVGYRLAPLDHISVEKVLASTDGFCGMTDPELTDAENVAEAGADMACPPDDCRVERESARIDVRRGRVTTRIMDNPTGGDGVLASRHTSYMDIDRIVLPEFDAKSIAAFVTGPLPQSERRPLKVEDYPTAIRDDGDTFLAGLHESMLGHGQGVCHWRSELSADPVRVFVHWLECETAYAPYGGEANRLCRHMADILERTFLK